MAIFLHWSQGFYAEKLTMKKESQDTENLPWDEPLEKLYTHIR